jgi:hypothetical protein
MFQKFDERNRDLIVNINGQLIHRDKAGISPFDSAVQVAFSNYKSISIGCTDPRPRFLSPKFRLAKKSSKKSSAPLPLTRCRTAFTFV